MRTPVTAEQSIVKAGFEAPVAFRGELRHPNNQSAVRTLPTQLSAESRRGPLQVRRIAPSVVRVRRAIRVRANAWITGCGLDKLHCGIEKQEQTGTRSPRWPFQSKNDPLNMPLVLTSKMSLPLTDCIISHFWPCDGHVSYLCLV